MLALKFAMDRLHVPRATPDIEVRHGGIDDPLMFRRRDNVEWLEPQGAEVDDVRGWRIDPVKGTERGWRREEQECDRRRESERPDQKLTARPPMYLRVTPSASVSKSSGEFVARATSNPSRSLRSRGRWSACATWTFMRLLRYSAGTIVCRG